MKFSVHLTGTRPLLMHNGRLANPLDPYAIQLKTYSGKRLKTDEDHAAMMHIEARAGVYETTDGFLGMPTSNVWSSICEAAKKHRLGTAVKRALLFEATVQPLLVDGDMAKADDYIASGEHILVAGVRIGTKRIMRSRPIVDNWQTTHHFELLDDELDPRSMVPVLERAGRLIGLGDWRPTYGTFACEVDG